MDSSEANAVSSLRRVASRAGLWGGRGATAPLTPDEEIEVAHCQRESSGATYCAGCKAGENLGGPGWAGRGLGALPARNRPCLSGPHPPAQVLLSPQTVLNPVPNLPSVWSTVLVIRGWGHTSWSATFLEISEYTDDL